MTLKLIHSILLCLVVGFGLQVLYFRAYFLIPQSIISENAEGEQYAYIAMEPNADNEATAKKIIITTGKTQGAFIEVLSGIEDGNQVIKEGARSVKDGQKVKIIN